MLFSYICTSLAMSLPFLERSLRNRFVDSHVSLMENFHRSLLLFETSALEDRFYLRGQEKVRRRVERLLDETIRLTVYS